MTRIQQASGQVEPARKVGTVTIAASNGAGLRS
jgi:hypothetical protein